MNNINLSTRVKRNNNYVEAKIDGETVMMDMDSGDYYGLDAIASRIWQLLESQKTVDEICQQLLKEYEVTEEQCQQDVISFLDEMAKHNTVSFSVY